MSGTCDALTEAASAGVAPALRAVDCVANEMAAGAFGRLFGASGAMAPVLTIALTLYIAFFAFSLLTGRASLGISALTPRMLRLGVVLTFATSWIAYQGVVWNLAVGAPDWIAGLLMGAKGSATQLFGERIDIIFGAIADIAEAARQGGQDGAAGTGGGGAASPVPGAAGGMFTPESVMWLGAMLLLLGTVGVLLTARIALAVLLAIGPVFVIMGLFEGTRGLTAGWLRGVALTAVTPLFVVLGGGVTLELLVPIIAGLVEGANAGAIDGRGAMALFLVAAVHVALMFMVVRVAGTMVAGWQVVGLGGERQAGQGAVPAGGSSAVASTPAQAGAAATASSYRRDGGVAAVAASLSHGGDGLSPPGTPARSTTQGYVVTQVSGGGIEPVRSSDPGAARLRGIGSRFRSASNDTGRIPAKESKR